MQYIRRVFKSLFSGHCTGFFEYWIAWQLPPSWRELYKIWRVIYLGELCEEHDKECSSSTFGELIWKHKVVGGFLIWLVAVLACWYKYFFKMLRRV